jgi:undecaprenyl-diphosphatase
MSEQTVLEAAFLGLVEGVTEFIPVSSTAHILLAEKLLGLNPAGNGFEVLVQFGAILAVIVVYAAKLWQISRDMFHDRRTQKFVLAVLLAFLPSAIVGFLARDFIVNVLFAAPRLMAVAMIVGGIVLLFIDRMKATPRHTNVMDYPLVMAFGIGLVQVISMIPGVSRSGATIVGAMLMGADKRSAAEFSFFLSMPTMIGAFSLDLYKNRDLLDSGDALTIGVGFAVAFLSGLFVVKTLLDFVSKRGFAVFGWWRIIVGAIALVVLGGYS